MVLPSPYIVAAATMSAIIALTAISQTSMNMMNHVLEAQHAIKIQADKASEDIKVSLKKNDAEIKNNAIKPVVIRQVRITDGVGKTISKIDFSGTKLGSFGSLVVNSQNFSLDSFDGKKMLAITDLGNTFSSSDGANATGAINGMGVNSRIIQIEKAGKLNYGTNIVGQQDSLVPYKKVPPDTAFAGQILDTDGVSIISIPRLDAKFRYDTNTENLVQISSQRQNILGFLQARTVGGVAEIAVSDGIVISGSGTVIIKLDVINQNLLIDGLVPAGATLYLGKDPQYDYFSAPYHSTYGFAVWSGSLPTPTYSQNGCTYVASLGSSCSSSWTYVVSFLPPLVVSSVANFNSYYGTSWQFLINSATQNPDNVAINSIKMVSSASSGYSKSCNNCYPTTSPVPNGQTILAYDKEVILKNKISLLGEFQTQYLFDSSPYYIVAKPNGGTIKIRGVPILQSLPLLEIENLPKNIPFEIQKNAVNVVSGLTSSDGRIVVLPSEFSTNDVASNLKLKIYPDSISYRGPFSTILFDNVNRKTLHIPTTDSKIYVASAYASIPVLGKIELTDVFLDNLLPLEYLNGNYTSADHIMVPIVAGFDEIEMKINGIPTTILVSNLLGGGGLKVVGPTSSTISKLTENGIIPFVSATAGGQSYVIATSRGLLTTSLTATISAESQIQNSAQLEAVPPPPQPPQPKDPLKAYVEVYKNGVLEYQKQIYFNSNPVVQNTGSVEGTASVVTSRYLYPQTVINDIITTPVSPGDMIEFYLYANIYADGETPAVPSGYKVKRYLGVGTATVRIHSGSILTS